MHVQHLELVIDLNFLCLPHIFEVKDSASSAVVALPVRSMSLLKVLLLSFDFDQLVKLVVGHLPWNVERSDLHLILSSVLCSEDNHTCSGVGYCDQVELLKLSGFLGPDDIGADDV